jgi:hypothetical protein
MQQGWEQVLGSTTKDGGAGLTNVTPQSILPGDTAKCVIPAQDAWGPGKAYRVKAFGKLSSAASSPGNITLDIRFGSVIVFTTQAIALATSLSNNTWLFDVLLIVRTIGNSTTANVIGAGTVIGATATAGIVQCPATSPAVGTGYDSTASQAVDCFLTFSASSASNLLTCNGFVFESLN